MGLKRTCSIPLVGIFLLLGVGVARLAGFEHHGFVKFKGLAVPGATVTAAHEENRLTTISDESGFYSFPDLIDGRWSIQVEKVGFVTVKQDVVVAQDGLIGDWELRMLPAEQIQGDVRNASDSFAAAARASGTLGSEQAGPEAIPASANEEEASQLIQQAREGLLINGSVNNGAFTPFAQAPSFGNFRRIGSRSIYNGSIGFTLRNAAMDARAYSLTGQNTPKPDYNRFQGLVSGGGPLRIPHLLSDGPNVTINYQWTRNRNASVATALMPTESQRSGLFSSPILDPSTGGLFPGNSVPLSRMSVQALTLLNLYPLPNFLGGARYNYQVPIVGVTHQDDFQARANKSIGASHQFAGAFAFQSARMDNPNVFGFLDKLSTTGFYSEVSWRHALQPQLYGTLTMQFSRFTARTTPFFAGRRNVAQEAQIEGTNQEPANWGPPALIFSSGIASLSDAQQSLTRNQTVAISYEMVWNQRGHTLTYGGDFRRDQNNLLGQQDPRGTFTFTGAASGSDFAGFLLGIPDTSSISYGNADKYLRYYSVNAYAADDWRIKTGLTVNVGLRWEYASPITERYGRLVNLDVRPGFTAATPVIASRSSSPLLRPDANNFAPRLGFAWRPLPASSMVVRGGYGLYYDSSVYQIVAPQMAQQAPLSSSIRVQNSPENPLTLARGFKSSASITPTTFAIDPRFRVGYAQNWQVSVQRDLPGALIMTVQYAGVKGTRGAQQFLPNTFPGGAVVPSGFVYMTSNGNSVRHAGQIQLRRRLQRGFAAGLEYTYSKSIDYSGFGGSSSLIAQNWLDLKAERSLSNFDQRHLLSAQLQYTTAMTFAGPLRGLFQEWTAATQITVGTGRPLTPVYLAPVNGTGVTGSIRASYTGAPVYDAPKGLALNPGAFAPPAPGQWGNAGRNSITGPSQFTLNASLARTFRLTDILDADVRIDIANALNHPVFPSWNTVINNAQFGLPNPANPMRNVQATVRVRF